MINIYIHPELQPLFDYYNAMLARAKDPSLFTGDVNGAFAKALSDISAEQFASEGAYLNGTGWEPLSEATLKNGNRRGGILEKTGALVDSLIYMQGAGFYFSATPQLVSYGNTSAKAAYVSGGTPTIPARPIYPDQLPPEVILRLLELLNIYIEGEPPK